MGIPWKTGRTLKQSFYTQNGNGPQLKHSLEMEDGRPARRARSCARRAGTPVPFLSLRLSNERSVILITWMGDPSHGNSIVNPAILIVRGDHMTHDEQDLLELLKFELKFLEDGGYGRSPHTPWRRQSIFEDSPSCLNFRDPARPHACSECQLMEFVPAELRGQASPCRLIPLNSKGETIDYFYRCGTQLELEEALAGWLRNQIREVEERSEQASKAEPAGPAPNGSDSLTRKQWLAFAGNLYALANRHRMNHDYEVAHALYGRALEAAEKVVTPENDALSLSARILHDQLEVFAMLPQGQGDGRKAESEALHLVGR